MKTEQEIRSEIEATKRTIENHRNAYRIGNITKEVFHDNMVDCQATISALSWVLGENERYD